jgi:adenylosuccinate synthase
MKPKHFFIAGLGLGDEGKGSIVDFLVRKFGLVGVARYNGGPQAAHHVVTAKGLDHSFHQFGSGSFTNHVKTYLDKRMLVDPFRLKSEAKILKEKIRHDPYRNLIIHGDCLVVTPYHRILNQMREIVRAAKRHGSCGLGVGEAISDSSRPDWLVLRIKDLQDHRTVLTKLQLFRDYKIDQAEEIQDAEPDNPQLVSYLQELKSANFFRDLVANYVDFYRIPGLTIAQDESVKKILSEKSWIFEGSQGVLLDRCYGFQPHVTKTTTTFQNAEEIREEYGLAGEIMRLGILRAYSTRHGAGPFITSDEDLSQRIPEEHNVTNEWQGEFRIGWLDTLMIRYSLDLLGNIDGLVLTNLDRLSALPEIKICIAYEYSQPETEELKDYFEYAISGQKIIISRIKKTAEYSERHQQRLTRLLADCRPIYQEIAGGNDFTEKYVVLLEQVLGNKIRLLSRGPTSQDKKLISLCT